jgi:hypothetical protein
MTLQLLHSEFPYIWGKFDFLLLSVWGRNKLEEVQAFFSVVLFGSQLPLPPISKNKIFLLSPSCRVGGGAK